MGITLISFLLYLSEIFSQILPHTPANPPIHPTKFPDSSLVTLAMIKGDVWIIRNQATYRAEVGDIIHPGDLIHSRDNGYAKIISARGVLINLSAFSTLKIHHDNEFDFLYGRYRIHSHSHEKIWLRTPSFVAWPEQGEMALDIFQQGAKVKTQLAIIGGQIYLSPIDSKEKDLSYKLDRGVMWDSFLYNGVNPAAAISKLPENVITKLNSDRMNRYTGYFLFDLVYPDNPFPGSLGPRFPLGRPPKVTKLLPRMILKERDRNFLKRGLDDETRIQGRDVAWYPRGLEDFETDLRAYVRPKEAATTVDEFWDQKLVRPLTDYERRQMTGPVLSPMGR